MIQSIGRAARNLNGKAILYADTETGSIKRAMKVTQDRRDKQQAYNVKMGITPKSISRKITDVLEAGREKAGAQYGVPGDLKVAEEAAEYESMSPGQLNKRLAELEKEMYEHAKNLEFEEAAVIRDRIEQLKTKVLGPQNG